MPYLFSLCLFFYLFFFSLWPGCSVLFLVAVGIMVLIVCNVRYFITLPPKRGEGYCFWFSYWVCLSFSLQLDTKKLLDQFPWKFQKRYEVALNRFHYILVKESQGHSHQNVVCNDKRKRKSGKYICKEVGFVLPGATFCSGLSRLSGHWNVVQQNS